MEKISWMELFPTKLSLLIFILYVLLFVNQGILVTASQGLNNEYAYNIVTVVLMTEVFKLVASVCLYCRHHTIRSLISDVYENKHVLALYFVPASLYCLYNNLSFINLSKFDPTTYFLLLQLRIGLTGILFQVIFSKTLTRKQWFSLLLLTIGCMVKNVNFTKDETPKSEAQAAKVYGLEFSLSTVLMLVQTFSSSLAGVYNEYLLKKTGASINIFIQNIFMYLDSIVCNVLVLAVQGNLYDALTVTSLWQILHVSVLVIMINNAAAGIITSFFLKTLNSILKSFANALELILVAILSCVFFGIPIYASTVLSIVTVLAAVYLYSQNPVSNVSQKHDNADQEELLMEKV